jgi:hypothetical protein
VEIFKNVGASQLGVASGVSAQHGPTGMCTAVRGGLPTGLPMFGAGAPCTPMQEGVWQRPSVDANTAVRTYALTTIKRNAVAGVRPGLRSTSPPV